MVGQRPRVAVGARKDARFFSRGASDGGRARRGACAFWLAGKPNPASFLQMLVFACKPEDFVVVKLDIDTPAKIEQTIVAVLAQRPDLDRRAHRRAVLRVPALRFRWSRLRLGHNSARRRRHCDRHDVQASLAWHPRALLDLKSRACKRVCTHLLPGELCRHVRDPRLSYAERVSAGGSSSTDCIRWALGVLSGVFRLLYFLFR